MNEGLINDRPAPGERVSVNDLPKHTSWVEKLLHPEEVRPTSRDGRRAKEEYRKVYGFLLDVKEDNPEYGPDDLRTVQNSRREDPMCVSRDGELYLTGVEEARRVSEEILLESLRPLVDGSDAVVELGCGYGYNLWLLKQHFPDCTFYGGDISEHAVELGERLFGDDPTVHVDRFDFYDDRWRPLERASRAGDVVLLTHYGIEQVPDAEPVVAGTLGKYLGGVGAAVHLEPLHELYAEETLLGQLRRRYTVVRDYNRNLLSTLREDARFDIADVDHDLLGRNPLHPLSRVRWRPAPEAP